MPYFIHGEYTLNPGLLSFIIFISFIYLFFYPHINHLFRKEYLKDT